MRYLGLLLISIFVGSLGFAYLQDSISSNPLTGSKASLIPLEVLFAAPTQNSKLRLSRDGTKLAYMSHNMGRSSLWVKTVNRDDARILIAEKETQDIMWSCDSKTVLFTQMREKDGVWGLYSVDSNSGTIKHIRNVSKMGVTLLMVHENMVIVGVVSEVDPEKYDLYTIDYATGKILFSEKNPGNIDRWLLDNHGELRGKLLTTSNGDQELSVRSATNSAYKKIKTENLDQRTIIGFNKNGNALYMVDGRSNTPALIEFDLATHSSKLVYTDPDHSITEVIYDQVHGLIEGVIVNKTKAEVVALDYQFKERLAKLEEIFAGEINILASSADKNTALVSVVSDTVPKTYYTVTFSPLLVRPLWSTNHAVQDYTLAPKESFAITAHDGLRLEGYITYPVGLPRKNLPIILNVHGGPRARDSWSYDPIVQWIANRGYACVQVNFRGSRGYGKSFMHAGDKEWGNHMFQDLIDTVNYCIDQGIADPKRIAIFGASYGGYAALCGAAFTPDLFCCALDICGPCNLVTLARTMAASPESIHEMIGNPDTERELLTEQSPLFSAERIKIPILIAHGGRDLKVPKAESEQMVEALTKYAVPHEYLFIENEGHGLNKVESMLTFFAQADRFLERYL
jgi:dipeptidyl aminopeptidase/acylaminoacyl peptidase